MKSLQAINIEQSILGSLIVDESIAYKIQELKEDMFTVQMNKDIYSIMNTLHIENKTLDIQTIKTKLDEKSIEVTISYISNLTAMCQCYAIDTHIQLLKEIYIKRNVVKNCQNLLEDIGQGENLDLSIYKYQNKLEQILNKEDIDKDDISSICEKVLNFLENNDEKGFRFGINILDYTIGGLFKGELTTIAAKSGTGKTALAHQIMDYAVEQNKKVLLISREMSNEQIIMRSIAKSTGISTKKMKYKEFKEEEWIKIISSMENLNKSKLIHINDRISTISGIKRRIRQIKPDLVIVDYIQLLSSEGNYQNREREVANLSRELKNITLDFNIPVIQLSQLNDEMKDFRPWGERPMRDSKALYHDSNNVIYIHEPVGADLDEAIKTINIDKKQILKAKDKGIKLVDVIVAKCRDGETKLRHYCYNGPKLKFQELNY